MSSCCLCQDSLIRERLLVERGDTFIVVPYMRAKILFEQVAKLSEFKRVATKSLAVKDSIIQSKEQTEAELKLAIQIKEQITNEKDFQIESWKQTVKNTRKKWIKITLYSSTGAAVIGLITGILIMK